MVAELGGQIPPEDLHTLERLGGMDDPGQERIESLGG
jgi:hypothetical protein